MGLACALEARRHGLSHVMFEKGALLNTLCNWPTHTVFFSTADLLEIGGVPFVTLGLKPTRREALVYYRKLAERFELNVRLHEPVESIQGQSGGFVLKTPTGETPARFVVVATGFFDKPNLMGIPGEDLPKVTHYYREPFPYFGLRVLVVGGRNSAVEAALDLFRNGAKVTMAVRGPAFGSGVKYWLRPDIDNRIQDGAIQAHFNTQVLSIRERSVTLSGPGGPFELPNDFVVAMTGYRPDFDFLRRVGIDVRSDEALGYDVETMETNVPGIYVAGVVAGGSSTSRFFIENGREHATRIVTRIAELLHRRPEAPLLSTPVGRFQEGD